MNKPTVYFQGPNGEEHTMRVTSPDPDDGTFCGHFTFHDFSEVTSEWWVRIVPFMTTEELFNLGAAYGSFSVGEIDQGIHLVLPVTDSETGEPSNEVFTDLVSMFDLIDQSSLDWSSIGEQYMDAIVRWTKHYDVKIGR